MDAKNDEAPSAGTLRGSSNHTTPKEYRKLRKEAGQHLPSVLKRAIVAVAIRGCLSPNAAHWLIQTMGLIHA